MTTLAGVLERVTPRGRFVRAVAVLAGGTVTAQALMFLAMPALTRLYAPQELGALAAYATLLSIPCIVGGFCFERAIPLASDDVDAASLVVVSMAINTGLALMTAAGIAVAGDEILRGMNSRALGPYLWLLPVSMVLLGLAQNMTYWSMRTRTFPSLARSKVSQALGLITTQVGLGLLHAGPVGLVLGDVVGRLCGSATYGSLAWRHGRDSFAAVRPAGLRRVAWRYRKFSWAVVPGFCAVANVQAPMLIVATCFGPADLARFALAQQLVAAPLGLLGGAIGQAFGAETARPTEADTNAPMALLRALLLKLALTGAGVWVIVAVAAPPLCGQLFGAAWREVGVIMAYIAPMFVAQFVFSPISVAVQVLERQEVLLYREFARSAALVVALLLIPGLGGELQATIAAFSVAGTIGELAFAAIGWQVIAGRWDRPDPVAELAGEAGGN